VAAATAAEYAEEEEEEEEEESDGVVAWLSDIVLESIGANSRASGLA